MTFTFPSDGNTQEARLVSPSVTIGKEQCISFIVYFEIAEVSIKIGYTASTPSFNLSSYDVTPLATLFYPLDANMLQAGENSRLVNIHLAVPAGTYHIVIAAEGSDGGLAVWDMQQIVQCNNSSEIRIIKHCVYL
jgi:hypothetical protein